MAEKVPDYFEDPMERSQKEAHRIAKKIIPKCHKEYAEASVFSGFWLTQYEECKKHPEEADITPDMPTMIYGELVKHSCLLTQILQELRGKG